MIEKIYRFTCKDCKLVKEYPNKDEAQARGWGIAKGGKHCYCPQCAFKHRNTGCGGAKKTITGEQIKLSEVRNSA